MKKYLFLFLFTFFISCSKDDVCKTCTLTVESNIEAALAKCQGFANNYPGGFKVTDTFTEEHCENFPSGTTENTVNLCPGIDYTIRSSWDCK